MSLHILTPSGRTAEILGVYGKYDDDISADIVYSDSGEPVTDAEYSLIFVEYFDIIYQEWFEKQIDRADMLADAFRDGDI